MLKYCAAAAALMLTLPANAMEPPKADREALRRLAQQMDHAWNMAGADANAKLFSEKATARFGGEPLAQGRGAIRDQFRSFFTGRPPGLRHVTRIERMEQLAPQLVLWDAEVRVERRQAAGGWQTLNRIRNVTVAVRQADGWRVQAVRAFPVSQ